MWHWRGCTLGSTLGWSRGRGPWEGVRYTMSRRTTGLAAALALGETTSLGTVATASAAPATRLPDADLVCGSVTLHSTDWVALPSSGTLWIKTGTLAGHYVILSDAHYVVPGYLASPPASYDGLMLLDDRSMGTKAGLADAAMSCDFVSRWGTGEEASSVVGPIVIAPVGR